MFSFMMILIFSLAFLGINYKNYFVFVKLLKKFLISRSRNYVLNFFGCIPVIDSSKGEYGIMELYYYSDGGTKYKIISPQCKKGPRSITHFMKNSDEFLEDNIEKNIRECMGPYGNFHGIPTTPKMIGCNYPISIKYRGGKIIIYEMDDIINVNN